MNNIEFFSQLPYFDDDFIIKILNMTMLIEVEPNNNDENVNLFYLIDLSDLLKTMCYNPYVAYKIYDFLMFMVFYNGVKTNIDTLP